MLLLWIIAFSALGSIGAIGGAALFLLFPHGIRTRIVPWLISYAAGTLLGAAFLGMIPESLQQASPRTVATTILVGIVVFFVLEKITLWRHCHDDKCAAHNHSGSMILIGDAFHNFVDGVVITAAFLSAIPVGIVAAAGVIAHEVPQEIGDFAILLDSGFTRGKALVFNSLSAATTIPGAVIAYFWLERAHELTPYLLSFSAASFIYIATADLIPHLHRQESPAAGIRQVLLLLTGIATIAVLQLIS